MTTAFASTRRRSSSTPTRVPCRPWYGQRRRQNHPPRATAGRNEADRDSRGGRAAGRSRDAGRARRHRGDCLRAGKSARGAQGRRVDAAERTAEDRTARLNRSRPPHAADRNHGCRQQSHGPELPAEDGLGQSQLILAEAERLGRLFQNILEMARIDAGAVTKEIRWTHPSEIVAAARNAGRTHPGPDMMQITINGDVPVHLDPRLTATALAHLLRTPVVPRRRRRRSTSPSGCPGRGWSSWSGITARGSLPQTWRTSSSGFTVANEKAVLRHRHRLVDRSRTAGGRRRPCGEKPPRTVGRSSRSPFPLPVKRARPQIATLMTDPRGILLIDDETAVESAVGPVSARLGL